MSNNNISTSSIIITLSGIFSLGLIGYIIVKVGFIDTLLWLALSAVSVFLPLLAVVGILDENAYNKLREDAATLTSKLRNWKASEAIEGKEPTAE